MAEFLTTTNTIKAIERVIEDARESLTLVTAYLDPAPRLLERIYACGAKGVPTALIIRHDPQKATVLPALFHTPNLTLRYCQRLHSKFYFNEQEAIVTSANLTSHPNQSWEAGVLLDCETDQEAYCQLTVEAERLIQISEMKYRDPVDPAHAKLLPLWRVRMDAIASEDLIEPLAQEHDMVLRQLYARHCLRWHEAEIALLQEMVDHGVPPFCIAAIHRRKPSAIMSRIQNNVQRASRH